MARVSLLQEIIVQIRLQKILSEMNRKCLTFLEAAFRGSDLHDSQPRTIAITMLSYTKSEENKIMHKLKCTI